MTAAPAVDERLAPVRRSLDRLVRQGRLEPAEAYRQLRAAERAVRSGRGVLVLADLEEPAEAARVAAA